MNKKFINNLALLGAITTTGLQGSENPRDFLNEKTQESGTTQEVSHQTAPQSSGTQQTGTQRKTPDSYCMMIVSKYFENINDFINLEKTCKKYAGNMEKFHYNPISFGSDKDQAPKKRALFPNIETFHVYGESDKIFNDENITKQVDWHRISYSEYLKPNDETKEFKNIMLISSDVRELSFLIDEDGHCTVPEPVRALDEYCFAGRRNLTSISIPSNVSSIGEECFEYCRNLTSITIPSSVSSIGDRCFYGCDNLTSISIPSSVSSIGFRCFYECGNLTSITLPMRFKDQEEQIVLYRTEITYTQDNQAAESAETHPEDAQAEEYAEASQENEDGNDQTADAFSTNDEAWE